MAYELCKYVAPDGTETDLHVPPTIAKLVLSQDGWGAPPIQYITQRGPFQHGVTVRDYFLQPRTIQLFIRQGWDNRTDYWTGRAALLNAIRPNRQAAGGTSPGTIIITNEDGAQRAIDVYLADGPTFGTRNSQETDYTFAYQEVCRWTAFNPIVYDPNQLSLTVAAPVALVFPITFPITFSVDQLETIDYDGTWPEFPTIVLTGPMESVNISNETTGENIELGYEIAAGETVTIDLSYGTKSITSSTAGNIIGTLSTDSDLGTFHIAPDPEAAGGSNSIRFQMTGYNSSSSIVMSYYNRYFGI